MELEAIQCILSLLYNRAEAYFRFDNAVVSTGNLSLCAAQLLLEAFAQVCLYDDARRNENDREKRAEMYGSERQRVRISVQVNSRLVLRQSLNESQSQSTRSKDFADR